MKRLKTRHTVKYLKVWCMLYYTLQESSLPILQQKVDPFWGIYSSLCTILGTQLKRAGKGMRSKGNNTSFMVNTTSPATMSLQLPTCRQGTWQFCYSPCLACFWPFFLWQKKRLLSRTIFPQIEAQASDFFGKFLSQLLDKAKFFKCLVVWPCRINVIAAFSFSISHHSLVLSGCSFWLHNTNSLSIHSKLSSLKLLLWKLSLHTSQS